jgi:predicted esterase
MFAGLYLVYANKKVTMQIHYLTVKKTARFFTLGTLNPQTKEVWFVLHGYAQLGSDFIKQFEMLVNDERFIIAPEGLNKFYTRGFGGNPAASWMTSEDRLHEIADYMEYLQQLYESLQINAERVKVILLGFSQGVATASRWLAASKIMFNHFVVCSGEIAAEMQHPIHPALTKTPVTYITGNADKLISSEKLQAYVQLMQSIKARMITFEGGHIIDPQSVLQAANIEFAQ